LFCYKTILLKVFLKYLVVIIIISYNNNSWLFLQEKDIILWMSYLKSFPIAVWSFGSERENELPLGITENLHLHQVFHISRLEI